MVVGVNVVEDESTEPCYLVFKNRTELVVEPVVLEQRTFWWSGTASVRDGVDPSTSGFSDRRSTN
jgi:hypothetical protein